MSVKRQFGSCELYTLDEPESAARAENLIRDRIKQFESVESLEWYEARVIDSCNGLSVTRGILAAKWFGEHPSVPETVLIEGITPKVGRGAII